MTSLQGQFLVASPKLDDTNFYRSVVLMLQHDENGALGVILNRPMQKTIGDIWKLISEDPCECDQPLNLGGPVEGPLMAVHTRRSCSENEVLPGIYLATQKDLLDEIVRQADPFRIFSGYAGWAGGQLERELEVGGWLTAPARTEQIFGDSETLWKEVTRDIGLNILAPNMSKTRVPEDPSVN